MTTPWFGGQSDRFVDCAAVHPLAIIIAAAETVGLVECGELVRERDLL